MKLKVLCTPLSGLVHMGCTLCQVFLWLICSSFKWENFEKYIYLKTLKPNSLYVLYEPQSVKTNFNDDVVKI